MSYSPIYASFWDHLEDLRQLFFRIIIILAGGMILAFTFSDKVIDFLISPLNLNSSLQKQEIIRERLLNTSNKSITYKLNANEKLRDFSPGVERTGEQAMNIPAGGSIEYEISKGVKYLNIFGPLEGMLAAFKVAFWIGLVGTSPIWIWMLLQFLAPAMTMEEKRLIWPFFLLSGLFLASGMAFAFWGTIPLANQYLMSFNDSIAANMWSLSSYLDYTLVLVLGHALGFEMGLVLLMLVRLGIVTKEMLISKRRYFIVFAFILAALLTPPDVLTQFMLAVPMVILYEITIIYAKMQEKVSSKLFYRNVN